MYPFLNGKIVYLRGLERTDLELLKKWLSDEKVTYYLEMGERPPTSEYLNQHFEQYLYGPNDISFIIMHKKDDVPIGWSGLHGLNLVKHSCDMRFFIGETKYRKMTNILDTQELLLEYAFMKLNMHKVVAGANVENKGSWKTLERGGFVKEGTFRDYVYRNGRYYDMYMYSILKKEYDERAKRKAVETNETIN